MHFKDSAPLTREQELKCIILAKRRNRAAHERLVKSNMRLVVMVTRPIALRYGGEWDDYIQEGVIGLTKAIERFEISRKLRLGTYAIHWIKAYASRYGQQQSKRQMASLDAPVGDDEFGETWLDQVPDNGELADAGHNRAETKQMVGEAVRLLNPVYREIAARRLMGEQTLEDIGDRMGVSRERVRQLEAKVKEKLSNILKTRMDADGVEIHEVLQP